MASTKINFDTKELQFDLSMELSGVISTRRWRRIYCREMQPMVEAGGRYVEMFKC
jgi:hypothetical protein